MIDWRKPYTASWRLMRIDQATWRPSGEVAGAMEATVSRDGTDDVPLLETASVTVDASEVPEGWHRIEAVVTQGHTEVVPVSTVLLRETGGTFTRSASVRSLTGSSVLQPASDALLDVGAYAMAGSDGAAVAAALLRRVTPAPVDVAGGFALSDHLVFDVGASILEDAWAILRSAGWVMRISGDGAITICPRPDAPRDTAPTVAPSSIMPGVSYETGYEGVPNVYVAIDGAASAEAVNDDPASPTSTVSRGRRVVTVDTSPTRIGGESLAAYAARRLAELRRVMAMTLSYERDYAHDVVPFDVLPVHVSGLVDGTARVLTQNITLGRGCRVEEKSGIEGIA